MPAFRTTASRFLVAAALMGGIASAAPVAHALTPPAPVQAIDDFVANPEPTIPPVGPGDLTNPEAEPECNPILASCDLTSNPDGPGDPGDDDGAEGSGDGGAEVDDAVVAQPTFTG